MCFTAAVAHPHFALVSTDSRITWSYEDGSIEHDTTGKLYQLQGGWLTGTGDVAMLRMGAEALGDVDAADLSAVSAALAKVEPESTAKVTATDPDADRSLNRFVLIRDEGRQFHAHQIRANGDVAATGTAEVPLLLSYGSGVTPEIKADAQRALVADLASAGDVPGLVRALARTQATLADATPYISREMHVGVMIRQGWDASTFHLAATVDAIIAGGPVLSRVPPSTRIWPTPHPIEVAA